MIRDEKMATAEYNQYGLPNLAKDEHHHFEFLSNKLKQRKK